MTGVNAAFLVKTGRLFLPVLISLMLMTPSLILITSETAGSSHIVEGNPVTMVSVSPLVLTGPPGWINVNDTFTVNVTVSDVTDLFYWQAGLSFNPTVLECMNFTEGPFLKAGGDTVWQPGTIDNEEGLITPHGTTLSGDNGVSGNGTLAFIAFKVKDAGTSTLHLEDVILLDSNYDKIKPLVLRHGTFTLPPGVEPGPPNAYFSYYPPAPYVNETVAFNASESTPDGGTIINYEWNFDDGYEGQGVIVNHTYTSPGEYNVTLTVTDNRNLTDAFSRLVTVSLLPSGVFVDVYTQRNGKGLNESSDSFAPQELVALTAYLIHNGTPVAGKLVTFRLYLPNGTMLWSMTSETDDDGLAFISYLIPSQPVFGLYSINASVSVEGETVLDTLWFKIGWLVEVLEVFACDRNGVPKTQFEVGEPLYFTVKLQSIRLHPTSAVLHVAILDDTLQLVMFSAIECIIPPEQSTNLFNSGAIPEWARVGNATAYAGALQWLSGPAFSPSVSAGFEVTLPIPDVAVVGVTTSHSEVYVGQSVTITVSVLNEYYKPQSFDVTVYSNTNIIQTLTITNLTPYTETDFAFIWDTSTVPPGSYIMSAQASTVTGEIDTSDNVYVDGTIQIMDPDPAGSCGKPSFMK